MKKCFNCGWVWEESRQPSFKESCPECTAYLHCCRNCALHDPTRTNECQSSSTEWVNNREAHNFCEEFQMADHDPEEAAGSSPEPASPARDKFLSLFGESETGKDEGRPEDKLKKLLEG